jgi:hypothetical protein
MKELFSEIALRFGDSEARVRASVGKPRLRQVGIAQRHHQLLDAPDLLIDERPQLGSAVALGRDRAR